MEGLEGGRDMDLVLGSGGWLEGDPMPCLTGWW